MKPKLLTGPVSMDCAICTNFMASKRTTCHLGHCICEDCGENVSKCPICHSDFFPSCYVTLENNSKIHPCLNKLYGCPYEDNVCNLINHKDWCQYEVTQCPFNAEYVCKWAGRRNDVIKHLKQSHFQDSCKADGSCYFLYDKGEDDSSPKKGCLILYENSRLYKLAWEIDAKRKYINWHGIYMGYDATYAEKTFKIGVNFDDASKNFSVLTQPWKLGYDVPTKLNFAEMKTLFKNKISDSVDCKLTIEEDDSDRCRDEKVGFDANFRLFNYKRVEETTAKFTPTLGKVLKYCMYSCGFIFFALIFAGILVFIYQLIEKTFV